MRLHGIDAPEFGQVCRRNGREWHCGLSALRALESIVANTTVRCTWRERDAYGRALATCFADGVNVNAKLVDAGLALAYVRYSERYVPEQTAAAAERRGLWGSVFTPPWRWRQQTRGGATR